MPGAVAKLLAVAVVAGVLGSAQLAWAQLCHDLPDLEAHHRHGGAGAHHHHAPAKAPPAHATGLALGLRAEAATAALQRRPIDYQGASLRLDVHRGRFHLRAQGSWYRLRDSLEVTYGLGDALLAVMWTAIERPSWRAGIALPLGIPVGSQEDHMGMGHWMVMPGGFLATRLGPRTTLAAGLAFHAALGSSGHNHGIGPYVNPMTASEVSAAARVAHRVAPALQLLAESALAVPLDGERRAIVGAGFTWQRDAMSLTLIVQGGALSAPFTGRGVADVAYAF